MMDHGQIVREYRASKNKAESVKVLAELNGTTAEEIRRILIEGGVKPEELPRKPRNKNATPEEIRRENADDELSRAIQALRRIAEGLLTERGVPPQERQGIPCTRGRRKWRRP